MLTWTDYPMGDHRVQCPICQRRDKSLGVSVFSHEHGVAHCFRCGYIETRQPQRELTPAEREAYKRRMDAMRQAHDTEQRARQEEASILAGIRWADATPATEHPYLERKAVKAHGLKVEGSILLIPLRDSTGKLHSLQTIFADGTKRFLPGGRVKGCYHAIGALKGRLIVCEGYATGATIHADTGQAVAVAFNASNLLPVAQALRSKYPGAELVIAADDDWQTDGNPGLTAARKAAQEVGALLAVPDFTGLDRGPKDSDFNDVARLAAQEVHA